MLTLTRSRNKDDNVVNLHVSKDLTIKVMVLSVSGGQVRLGFDAPKDQVTIVRDEIDNTPKNLPRKLEF